MQYAYECTYLRCVALYTTTMFIRSVQCQKMKSITILLAYAVQDCGNAALHIQTG